jgi:hypothetical protein
VQRLVITTGEILPDEVIPLLKSRRELSRAEALKLPVVMVTTAQTDPLPPT